MSKFRTKQFSVPTGAIAAAVVLGSSLTASATLVAEWNFNAGNVSDLTSTNGSYTFSQVDPGSNATINYNGDGTISLGNGKQLYTTALNSIAKPTLTSKATILMRMRFDSATPGTFGGFAGLMQGSPTPNGAGAATTALAGFTANPSNLVNYYAVTNSSNVISAGSGLPTVPTGGSAFVTIAIVFSNLTDMGGNPSATKSQSRIYVDGVESAREAAGTSMTAFNYFAIGRIFSNNSVGGTTFDYVRVYDEALTKSQIDALVSAPEPATLGLLSLALGGLLCRKRR